MALKVYGAARTRTVRTLWMMGELGMPYEHIPITTQDGANLKPDYVAVNPTGRVPAIDDGGFVLSESMAINLYLAKTYGGALYPATPQGEARAWQWSFWAVTEIDKTIIEWALHSSVLPEAERDSKRARAARLELERPLEMLEGALAHTLWLAEDRFTVADLNAASVMYRALWMDLDDKPHARDWLRRCWDRPAARAARAMRE
ncbi:glutathione S-transferase family protein [Reyranella sp. CPCC 100927]|uniref:glutathione S-transferase family protein n=1 Tax=Reyranella sp. CPCC 100927 TaxID=2599616 RepID=UPI0015B57DCC|nr:glutathione S-transferase family protein [Reyranella sp. CPCC 100927]